MKNFKSATHEKKSNGRIKAIRFFAPLIFLVMATTHTAQAREMIEYPRVRLQSLDKATARTMTFDAKVGNTLKFGPLYIRVKTCKKTSPVDEPESAAFLQVWEVDKNDKAEWVFSGWMFASSPGLSPMDHPIYDVWVLDCLDMEDAQAMKTQGEDGAEETEDKILDADYESTEETVLD